MALADLMRHRVDVYSFSATRDSSGRMGERVFAVLYSTLPCNVQPAVSQVITEYQQRDERPTYSLYWIDATKVLTIGYRVVYDGKNYKVIGLKKDTQRGLWYRADLELEQA